MAESAGNPIRLTQTVQKGGCAAKVAASELHAILQMVQFPPKDASVLVDGEHFDDAGIYKVTDEVALVQTLDFFTPIVDTPKIFGAVAAANALSDVYAMGGDPKTAMAILAFPLANLSREIIADVLQGASDKMREAGVSLLGGHSIDDDTLKFGLSVTGYVHPQRIWSNAGAKPGDILLLTKPLGTGTCMAGLKRSIFSEQQLQAILQSMMQLNRVTDLFSADVATHIHAATDITGFGLLGHAVQMAQASRVQMQMEFAKLPLFDLAMSALEQGLLTKAHRSNAEYVQNKVRLTGLNPLQELLLCDPQTSGGLLLAVAPAAAPEILRALKTRFLAASQVGVVQSSQDFAVAVQG